MKKIINEKKLVLNKETITTLNEEMKKVVGGNYTDVLTACRVRCASATCNMN